MIVIGTPRPGGALRLEETESAKQVEAIENAGGYASVRAVESSLGPSGRYQLLVDYVFVREPPSGWRFVRRVSLFIVE